MITYVMGVMIFIIAILAYQLYDVTKEINKYINVPRKDSLKLIELLKQQANVLTWLIALIVILLYLTYRIYC